MKKVSSAMIALLLPLLPLPPALGASAQELRPLPPVLRTLSDEVGVMSVEEGLRLSRAMEDITDRTGVRVVMVVAQTTSPEAVEDYGERLARRWRRERQLNTDRSVFVVLAVQDREIQVMPGKALPGIDRELERAGTLQQLPPLFRAGRYFEGLMKLTSEIDRLIRKRNGRAEDNEALIREAMAMPVGLKLAAGESW